MRIGWRSFLKQKLRKKSAYHAVGIAISEDSVTFCAIKKLNDEFCVEFEETVMFKNWGDHLVKWVNNHKLDGTPTVVSFSIHWYQILQVDRPANVEESEIPSALSWSVKELTGNNNEMVIDYIDLPVPLSGNAKLNVIALPKKDVELVCEQLFVSGLSLAAITVEELATCELIPAVPEATLTLIQETGQEICLNIIKDGQLYLSRRLKGFENLGSFSPEELNMGIGESLSVQIQRSMDFYESQLRQAPVRNIKLRLDTPHRDALIKEIEQVVVATVAPLSPAITSSDPDIAVERLNYSSLGCALTQVDSALPNAEGIA